MSFCVYVLSMLWFIVVVLSVVVGVVLAFRVACRVVVIRRCQGDWVWEEREKERLPAKAIRKGRIQ